MSNSTAGKWVLRGVSVLAALAVVIAIGQKLFRQAPTLSLERLGGTVLVYEIDPARSPLGFQSEDLVFVLQRRLDSLGLRGITVRLLDGGEVEIAVPDTGDLAEQVLEIKELVTIRGELELRIVANERDDDLGIAEAQFPFWKEGAHPAFRKKQEELARAGLPPPPVKTVKGTAFETPKGQFTYAWVELAPAFRAEQGLDDVPAQDFADPDLKKKAAESLEKGLPVVAGRDGWLIYARPCLNAWLFDEERRRKKVGYFLLCRDPEKDPKTGEPMTVSGRDLETVHASVDQAERPAVDFSFNQRGGDRLFEMTAKNRPSPDGLHTCTMAIIFNGEILSAPSLREAIRKYGQINGNFSWTEVKQMVRILEAGSLPAVLKPRPVSETMVKPNR